VGKTPYDDLTLDIVSWYFTIGRLSLSPSNLSRCCKRSICPQRDS